MDVLDSELKEAELKCHSLVPKEGKIDKVIVNQELAVT